MGQLPASSESRAGVVHAADVCAHRREFAEAAPSQGCVGRMGSPPTTVVDVSASDIQQTVDAVWRMEAAKIVATLTRTVGDVGLAEDLAADALVDALEQWPATGVPRNAGAWLTTVAKRKAIDHWRRQDRLDTKYATLARELETACRRGVGPRPHRRRRAAADLRRDAPGAVPREPNRVDVARGRRPEHRGDRRGLPDVEGHRRRADHQGEEDARRRRRPLRGPRPRAVSAPTLGGAQRHLPDLQRGLFRVVRPALDSR